MPIVLRPTLRFDSGEKTGGLIKWRTQNMGLGDLVRYVQHRMGLAETGVFDEATRSAVVAYQAARNLSTTGEVDGDTWEALDADAPANDLVAEYFAKKDKAREKPAPAPLPIPAPDNGAPRSDPQTSAWLWALGITAFLYVARGK